MPSGSRTEEGYGFTMEQVDRHSEGTYYCTADNGVGKPSQETLNVTVQYGPEIETGKDIIRTGNGDVVKMVCIVHARPRAEVSWSRNGQPLTGRRDKTHGHKHILEIKDVKPDNFGAYQCAARNTYGETTAEISLTGTHQKSIYVLDLFS